MPQLKLETSCRYLKGIGPKIAKYLAKLGVNTVEDLIYYFPRAYEDRTALSLIVDLITKKPEKGIAGGKIIHKTLLKPNRKVSILKIRIEDQSGWLTLNFFNQSFLRDNFKLGDHLIVWGLLDFTRGNAEMNVQEYEKNTKLPSRQFGRVVPLYALTKGITQKKLREVVWSLWQNDLLLQDPLPAVYQKKYSLISLKRAVKTMHFPESRTSWKAAHDRVVFDEFFYLQYCLNHIKYQRAKTKGLVFKIAGLLNDFYQQSLPYQLTKAQERVMQEIAADLERSQPMNRLLQGDVGSGKTEIAFWASLIAKQSGYQTAIMAPTEILAWQHYLKFKKRLAEFKGECRLAFYAGKTKGAERRDVQRGFKEGEIDVVVGTHALFQAGVNFNKLGLVIVDEQHRFGVHQRDLLRQKGYHPHLLVMTATPIPRTLSLAYYSDLDLSLLDEMPPGRRPIQTKLYAQSEQAQAMNLVKDIIQQKQQAFFVYPLVEESAKLKLKSAVAQQKVVASIFPQARVGLLHGQMPSAEKEKIMQQFKKHSLDILVATTVIEVGIDIPRAGVMVIEHAERFGLSQLHQLRGRVGRGTAQAYCLCLVASRSPESKKRLQAFAATNDGFQLAEVDLKLRGPGDILGVRQSGLPQILVADLIKDEKILVKAKELVKNILDHDSELQEIQHKLLKAEIAKRSARFFNISQLN